MAYETSIEEYPLPHGTDARIIAFVYKHPCHLAGLLLNEALFEQHFSSVLAAWQMRCAQKNIFVTWHECIKNNVAGEAHMPRCSDVVKNIVSATCCGLVGNATWIVEHL